MASSPITAWQIEGGKVEAGTDFLLLGSKVTADSDCSHEIRRPLLLSRKAMTNLVFWKAETLLCEKGPYNQGYGLPCGHIQLWELDYKEGRMPKNRCFQTVVLEKTLWDPMDCSLPGSSDNGILQARILEWVAISLSRGPSQLRNWTQFSCTAGRFFTMWAIRDAPIMS